MAVTQAETIGNFEFVFPSSQAECDEGKITPEQRKRCWGLDWMPYTEIARVGSIAVFGEPGNRHSQGEGGLPIDDIMVNMHTLLRWLAQPTTDWNLTDTRGQRIPLTEETLNTPGLINQNDLSEFAQAVGPRFFYGIRMELLPKIEDSENPDSDSSNGTPESEKDPSSPEENSTMKTETSPRKPRKTLQTSKETTG
jgi:hypothetical protein